MGRHRRRSGLPELRGAACAAAWGHPRCASDCPLRLACGSLPPGGANMPKDYPRIMTPPPGPKARAVIERDARVMSQNFAKDYPLVAERAWGPVVEDPDGNRYLDFAAGIAVAATGHRHPHG